MCQGQLQSPCPKIIYTCTDRQMLNLEKMKGKKIKTQEDTIA